MNFEALISDELYQLNLVLWMLQPVPHSGNASRRASKQGQPKAASFPGIINPVFRKAGFHLYAIEPSLPLPLELREKLRISGVEASYSPCPDVIIKSGANEFAIIECKKSLFGDGAGQPADHRRPQRQARGLFLNEPGVLSGALALGPSGVKATTVLYLFPSNGRADQTEGIEAINAALRKAGFATASLSAFALEVANKWVVMKSQRVKIKQPAPTWIPGAAKSRTWQVQKIDRADSDPRPMYIIPWIPRGGAGSDGPAKRLFGSRIMAWVVMQIGPAAAPAVLTFKVDDALRHATMGHFDRWENKEEKNLLRKNARDMIRRRIGKAKPESLITDASAVPGEITVNLADDAIKAAIIEALRGEIDAGWNDNQQGALFPEDGGPA